ncbi:hypothetical protein ACVW01_001855 [Thermostichus sp. MS-CIW-19]|jgi:hypothetical protein|uniref:hypothetical protein n=1 Tax=unclassified Synechococcus TaxID=2626047 RepID=UPI000069403B|nr:MULTISPECIES: hypothetical protein [unclassified Synechococcus]ABC98636.1 hypothetical protein CYA_0417 [Synechococcus sp. JA-3-3Ab]PIK85895.1 hypothetical protein SYN63AY4M2_05245 [Synechococcus sp. 63AY4M2]PIK89156.1 hypothetical protein SYN65AY6A5_09055 [Synechococcus sp. 65AY6A5]PIK91244.1 hypothetical protein SYN65AY6LI_02615 [Synechococcus sp. 65AY6Li]PIK94956.1 hypothetical protein SYN60AY4M2_05800 [Synechococcus sp. 60AY4M2]
MSALGEGLNQLRQLLVDLEEQSLDQPIGSAEEVLQAIEMATAFELFEAESSRLLLQIVANLWDRVRQHDLSAQEIEAVAEKLRAVGYTDAEIQEILDLEPQDN